ncbi:MAG: adenosine kinase, partial [Patescibacteria group bacterium]|nr:adenosine kinase [Patescibacteria group bacterium]
IVNDYEFMVLCDILQKTDLQIKKIIPTLVITKGSKGSIICGSKYSSDITVKPAKPNKVLDPTGAGDAYRAGFLYGYTRGFKPDICGMLGSVLALYALEAHGTQEHTFTKQIFAERFKQNYNILAPL